MSAGIIYSKNQIARAFLQLGCEHVKDATFKGAKTKSHSMWVTPWGHMFMAPDEGCGHWVIQEIIEREVEGTRPQSIHDSGNER